MSARVALGSGADGSTDSARLKVIPATVVRSYPGTSNLLATGLPDVHAIHNLKDGLRCRYLRTGNLCASIGETYTNRIASGSVTVRLVDCDSLNVIWAKHVESNFSTTSYYSSATQTQTTYLTDGQLLAGLIKNLGYEIAANFYSHAR